MRLVDFEMAAVDIFHEGLLMAPVTAIPRLLARHGLTFDDIALWEIHEAFSAQVLCHIKALDDKDFVRAKAGVEHTFGSFPRDADEPERRQRRARSSVRGDRRAYFQSGRQGTCGDAAGQPRHRQHLRRRRSRHGGVAGVLSILFRRDSVKERAADMAAPAAGCFQLAAFAVGDCGERCVVAGGG